MELKRNRRNPLPGVPARFHGSVRVIPCQSAGAGSGGVAPMSPSSPVRQQLAHASASQTLICHFGLRASCRAGWADSGYSGRAMSFGARPARTHGTAPQRTTAMTHIAIQEELNGKVVDWLERVTDEQYRAAPSAE